MSKTITIVGAGIAGLATGIYAQMNGYQTRIYEMHDLPGGLCTSWRRKGYLVDGCIHWLCGSGPGPALHKYWQELGAGTLTYVHHRVYIRLELPGLTFDFYTDADELAGEMLRIAPEDAGVIQEFCGAIRQFGEWHGEIPETPAGQAFAQRWVDAPLGQLVARMKNPDLCRVMTTLFWTGTPVLFALLPLGYSHMRSAGYPLGGSLAFAQAIERRYLELGGEVHYGIKVEKILVEQDRAVGLKLSDGSLVWEREGDVVSTMDAHATFFDLLDGRYLNDGIRAWFEQVPVIVGPVQVTVGVNMPLTDAPTATSGVLLPAGAPVTPYGEEQKLINIQVFGFDPSAAPPGKSTIRVNLDGRYDFWKNLRQDPEAYAAEKERLANQVIAALDSRFPGLAGQVEMVDVATPVTFERYTGNWQGSSQGWAPAPQAYALQKQSAEKDNWPVSRSLPGLAHFYMAGQWLEPFGGLPVAAITARGLIESLCRRDGQPFITTTPS
jgi:phytoene dehydrogenase-like protein